MLGAERLRRHRHGARRGRPGGPGRVRDRGRGAGRGRLRPSRCSPASGTPATRRWPTWWRHGSCITPTECGQHLVWPARRWWASHVAGPAGSCWPAACPPSWPTPQTRDAQARRHLTAAARHQLRVHRERLRGPRRRRWAGPRHGRVESCEAGLRGRARPGSGRCSLGHLGREDEQHAALAPAAGRLRRGPPARARLQPDAASRRVPGAQRRRRWR